jgi:hypothetical protein
VKTEFKISITFFLKRKLVDRKKLYLKEQLLCSFRTQDTVILRDMF